MSDDVRKASELAAAIYKLLAGQPPDRVGAVLADLVSVYLVGYPNFARAELLELHIETVKLLLPASEAESFGDDGHPFNMCDPAKDTIHYDRHQPS